MGAALLVLVAVIVAALMPARLVASKEVTDPDADGATVEEPTPYALVPAGVQPVAERVSYGELDGGADVDTDPDGRIFFVTVSEPAQSLLGWWAGRNEPEVDFLTHEEKYGRATPSARRTVNLQSMRTSSQVAQYVALQLAGYDPGLIDGPVQVQQFLCLEVDGNRCERFVPSEGPLDEGDIIVGVEDEDVSTLDELTVALDGHRPGDIVALTVDRGDDKGLTVEVELIESSDDPDRGIIGFAPFDTRSVELPFEIAFDTGEIGGPSAGLAFTLTLLDELTEGDLLGGVDVAVTGTIEINGEVGAIGGLPQKVSAVRQAGIGHFLVPATQADEVLGRAREIAGDDVEIIPVATVEEALAALERLGGDPLPGAAAAPDG